MSETSGEAARQCAWCASPAPEGASHCADCGAALAQRESIGELVIPGVTHVDPWLEQYSKDPLRIPGSSPSQSVAGSMIGTAAMVGGPAALAALAGLGAVAMTEYLGAGRGPTATQQQLEKLGQPSEAVLRMLERLKEQERAAGLSSSPADEPAAANVDEPDPVDPRPDAS